MARRRSGMLGIGIVTTYLFIFVLLPLSAVVWTATRQSSDTLVSTLANPQARAALTFTLTASAAVAVIGAVMGTLIAWMLVRDQFLGKGVINMLIDLPFALPTIVTGLTLLTLYGPDSPTGINLAFARAGVVAALLFVTLPFVVRAVQPVLIELDSQMEEAAASLGASPSMTLRRIILPNLLPGIMTGTALAFAKAIGEFGSVVLISGNIPFRTEVASVYIFGLIESDDPAGAAAVSTALLIVALVVLSAISMLQRRAVRHA